MNHSFHPSSLDYTICSHCKRKAVDHGPYATCEVCGKSEVVCDLMRGNILACPSCERKDNNLIPDTSHLDRKAKQVQEKFKEIDSQIKIQQDIFNAKTVAIADLKKAIDEDPTIPQENKFFVLARSLDERFTHLTDILFSKRQEVIEGEQEQKAIQIYYNELAKKLRSEEREKLRLKDVTYQPIAPDLRKQKKTPKKNLRYDKAAIKQAAFESGIPESAIQMVCVQRNCEPIVAVRELAAMGLGKK